MSLSIDLDGKTAFEPGTELQARLQWDLPSAPDDLQLRLVWNTTGKGTRDLEVVQTHTIRGAAAAGYEDFSLSLPHEPYSFSGSLISLIWALELIAFPSRESTRTEITIGPGAREILLRPIASSRMPLGTTS